jgi:hypothetical protein
MYCRLALNAAQSAGDIKAQVALLASLARLATYRGKPEQANIWYAQLTDLCQHHDTARHAFTDSYAAVTPAVMALYANDAQSAAQMVQNILATGHYTGWELSRLNVWLARCYLQFDALSEARKLLIGVFADAGDHSNFRQAARAANYLATIAIKEHDEEQACFYISECERLTGVVRDRRVLADLSLVTARLHTLRGDLSAARAALAEAIDLFERLGMRRELIEARAALVDLETRELAEAAG